MYTVHSDRSHTHSNQPSNQLCPSPDAQVVWPLEANCLGHWSVSPPGVQVLSQVRKLKLDEDEKHIYIYRKVSETSMDHPKISWNFHNSSGYSIYHHGSCPFFFAPAGCWDPWPPRPSAWPEASPTCPRAWPGVPRRSAARPGRAMAEWPGHTKRNGDEARGNMMATKKMRSTYGYMLVYVYNIYIYIIYNAKGLKNWFGNTRMVKSSTIWGGSEIPHSLRL